LNIEVVALDWKWLFIYPDHGVAVVNEVAIPVDIPCASRSPRRR
jgi:cytochrome o ubiquinol oxidase subunit 2